MPKIYWDGRIKVRPQNILSEDKLNKNTFINEFGVVSNDTTKVPNIFHDGWVEFDEVARAFEVFLVEERPYVKTGPNTHAETKAKITLDQIKAIGPTANNGHLFSFKYEKVEDEKRLWEMIFEGPAKDVFKFSEFIKQHCKDIIYESKPVWEATAKNSAIDPIMPTPISKLVDITPGAKQPAKPGQKSLNYLFSGVVICNEAVRPKVEANPTNSLERNIFGNPFVKATMTVDFEGRQTWNCKLCNIGVFSEERYDDHTAGKKHKKKLAQWYRSQEAPKVKPKKTANQAIQTPKPPARDQTVVKPNSATHQAPVVPPHVTPKKPLGKTYTGFAKPNIKPNDRRQQRKQTPQPKPIAEGIVKAPPPVMLIPAADVKVQRTLHVLKSLKLQEEKKKAQEKKAERKAQDLDDKLKREIKDEVDFMQIKSEIKQELMEMYEPTICLPGRNGLTTLMSVYDVDSDDDEGTVVKQEEPGLGSMVKTELDPWAGNAGSRTLIKTEDSQEDEEEESDSDDDSGFGCQWAKIELDPKLEHPENPYQNKPEPAGSKENPGRSTDHDHDDGKLRRYCNICKVAVLIDAWDRHIIGVDHKLNNYYYRMKLAAGEHSLLESSVTRTEYASEIRPVKKSTLRNRKARANRKKRLYENVNAWRAKLEAPKDYEEGYEDPDSVEDPDQPGPSRKRFVKSGPRKRKAPGEVTLSSVKDQMENPDQHVLHCPQCDIPIGDDKMMDAHEASKAHRHMVFKRIVDEVSAIPWKRRMVHRDVWFASGLGDAFHEKPNEFFVEMDRMGNDYDLYQNHPYCYSSSGEHHAWMGRHRRW